MDVEKLRFFGPRRVRMHAPRRAHATKNIRLTQPRVVLGIFVDVE